MTVTEYLVGLSWLLLLVAGFGTAAIVLRSWLLPGASGSLARLAEAVLATATLTVAVQVLGLAGLLSQWSLPLVALAIAAGLLAWQQPWRSTSSHRPMKSWWNPPEGTDEGASAVEPAWAGVLAVLVAIVTVVQWSGGVLESLDVGIYRQDSTWYHLPQAATFFQTGDTWSLHYTDPMALAAWFYPMGAELPHTVGMLAFGNDFLSPFVNLAWVLLALLAAWCAGRGFGLGAPSVLAVAIVLNSGMLEAQAGNAPGDVAAVFLLLATATFLLNGSRILASLAGGLAIGAKVTLLVPTAAVALGDVLRSERGRRAAAAGTWAAALLLTNSYWYIRNLVHAGNALPWVTLGPLAGPDQVGLYPRPPHSLAEYATDLGFWAQELFPRLTHSLGPLWPAIVIGAVAGLVLAISSGTPTMRVLGFAGIAAGIAYVFIPISASGPPGNPSGFDSNLRYLAPTLALGLLLAVLVAGRRAQSGVLCAALAVPFLLSAASANAWSWEQLPGGSLLALFIIVVPLGLALGLGRAGAWQDAPSRRRVALAAGAALVACLAAIAIGYPYQRSYLSHRYLPELAPPPDNPGFRATPEWRRLQAWALHQRERHIGVVGPPAAFGQYVFLGPDLSNRVDYVGEPGPHGAYRPIGDCASWRSALNRGAYDFVVITPATAIGPGTIPQEMLWLSGAAGARAEIRAGAGSVFNIDSRLSPEGCRDARMPRTIRVPGGGYAVPSAGLQDRPGAHFSPP